MDDNKKSNKKQDQENKKPVSPTKNSSSEKEKTPPRKRPRHDSHSSKHSHKSSSYKKSKPSREGTPNVSTSQADEVKDLKNKMEEMSEFIKHFMTTKTASSSKRKSTETTESLAKRKKPEVVSSECEADSDQIDSDSSVDQLDWVGAAQPTNLRQEDSIPSERMPVKPWMVNTPESEEEDQGPSFRRQRFRPGSKVKDNRIISKPSAKPKEDIQMGCPRLRSLNGVLVKTHVPEYCLITYQVGLKLYFYWLPITLFSYNASLQHVQA